VSLLYDDEVSRQMMLASMPLDHVSSSTSSHSFQGSVEEVTLVYTSDNTVGLHDDLVALGLDLVEDGRSLLLSKISCCLPARVLASQ
jgi:hypothetical protein